MKITYKYNPERKCLEEQPRMEKPESGGYSGGGTGGTDWEEYRRHLASLKSYDTPHTDWPEGELREGEHFKISKGKAYWYDTFEDQDMEEDIEQAIPLSPSQPDITDTTPLRTPIENALYATDRFTTVECSELADGILMYINDVLSPSRSEENDEDVYTFSFDQLAELLIDFTNSYIKSPVKDLSNDAAEWIADLEKYKLSKRI